MNNVVQAFVDGVRRTCLIVSRRRWLMFATTALVAAASTIGLAFFHDRYQATARVYVDTRTVLKPLMEGLTFQPDIEQQVSMLARTLISRPNVEKLVAIPELELVGKDDGGREHVISKLMSDIKIVPFGDGSLYDISYRGTSPERARLLVEATVNLFVDSGAGDKKRDSKEAGRFIDEQIRTYETKLTDSENRLKDFKIRNFGLTGVSSQDYFSRVSLLTEEVSKLRVDLSAAEQTRESYRHELADEDPQLPADLAGTGQGGSDAVLQARIEEQRRNLDDLLRRYTEQHPDVVNARRVLARLESDAKRKPVEDRVLGKTGRTGGAATSPVYQKLRISLAESEAQVASLRSQLGAKQSLLEQVRAAAGRQPEAEAELVQLNRDYEIIRKNYDLMVARRESAALGVKLDESSQLAEFRLVEPPRVSQSPVLPARWQLALVAFVVSLAAGIGAAIAVDHSSPTFDTKEMLRQLTGRPVLGAISLVQTPKALARRRASALRFTFALGALLAAQAASLAWTVLRTHIT